MHFSRCPRVCELTSTLVRLVLLACSYASQFAIVNESPYCDSQSLSPTFHSRNQIGGRDNFLKVNLREKGVYRGDILHTLQTQCMQIISDACA